MGRKKKMMKKKKKKKMKKGIITVGEDRISNLPESLIHDILSFLLMRDVIKTCLLSKRWRNIWKSVPVLNFGKLWHNHPGDNMLIDQSLIHYEGQKVKTLQVELDSWKNAHCVESWIRFAATHGVEELDMSASLHEDTNNTFPDCLFECLEMRVLRLSLDDCTPQPFRFPLLKELHFTDLTSNYFDTSACPLLEVLIIEGIYTLDVMEIYAPNPKLRYMYISEHNFVYYDNSRLTLYAPNLLHFEFRGSFGRFYEFKDISSVKTVNLYSSLDPNGYGMAELMVELLRNLTHVKSLKLSQSCILTLAYWETVGLEIPSLSATCLRLELETNLSKCVLVGITSLLRASRCIEQLIINMEDGYIYDESIFEDHDIDAVKGWESLEHALSVELALNTISIQNFPGYFPKWDHDWFNGGMESNVESFLEDIDLEIKLVEVLLKSSKWLKKMNISIVKLPSQSLKLQYLDGLTKKLLEFPRASLNAEVYIS